MSQKITTEEQFTFLISCIRHSEHGKVDFQKVANECSIVSKAAAAKRYERLMKSHGITLSKPTSSSGSHSILNASVSSTPRKNASTKTSPKTPTAKTKNKNNKRTFSDLEDDGDGAGDDDEGLAKKVKEQEYKTDAEKMGAIKEEKNGYYIIHHPAEEGGNGFDGAVGVKDEGGFDNGVDMKGFLGQSGKHGMAKKEEGVKMEVKVEEVKQEDDEDGGFAVGYASRMDAGSGMGVGVGKSIVIAD